MGGKRRQRLLSREEIELWAHVTRNDEALAHARAAASSLEAMGDGEDSAALQKSSVPQLDSEAAAQERVAPSLAKRPGTKRASRNVPPPSAPFDSRLAKRISRGRRTIDARLDLHGMRQQDAYQALRRFLTGCQAVGYQHVLIITGKGGRAEEVEDTNFWAAPQRGVLRRLVPQWLAEPEFRIIAVSFTESAMKHGGSGALYVTIRRRPARRAVSG